MKKRALLIGNENYQGAVSKILVAPKDITAIKFRLEQLSFNISTIADATLSDMINAIHTFLQTTQPDAINIIYFSGHGYQHEGINYIAPIDFSVQLQGTKDFHKAGMSVSDIMSFERKETTLILLIDACRNTLGSSLNYADMAVPQNSFLGYATQFRDTSQYPVDGISFFTQHLCNNILLTNCSIDEVFNNIRRDMIKYNCPHLSNTNSGLTKSICLNEVNVVQDIDIAIYDFIERFGDNFERQHGPFVGEFEVFVEASQYFGMSLLDTYHKYTLVSNSKHPAVASALSEETDKLITFFRLSNCSKLFTVDEWHTWYYKGRKVRMGEIPPLTEELDKPIPEQGHELWVTITATIKNGVIQIQSNLPDNFNLQVHLGRNHYWKECVLKNGRAEISLDHFSKEPFDSLTITSPTVTVMKDVDLACLGGKRGNNLCGELVRFDPIFGNMICCTITT